MIRTTSSKETYQGRVNRFGVEEWKMDGLLHRENGPARIFQDGRKEWYWKGKIHRNGGPAITDAKGIHRVPEEGWFILGILHRIDGPAITYSDGRQCWYIHGKRHRKNGPAIIMADGSLGAWYVYGVRIKSYKEYQRALNCNSEHIIIMSLKYGEIT